MFVSSSPIWIDGKEKEINHRVQFKTVLKAKFEKNYIINIATSWVYQLWVNGKFVSFGPARAGRNNFRLDEIDISGYLSGENNAIVIEVANYNVNSFVLVNQSPFIQAEIFEDNISVLWTGKHFTARINPFYIQKMQRYSFQRPMVEAYRIKLAYDDFFTSENVGFEKVAKTESKNIIDRNVGYPQYEKNNANALFSGNVSWCEPDELWRDRSLKNIGENLLGYDIHELEIIPTDECQKMICIPSTNISDTITTNQYTVYKLPYNMSGFLFFDIECSQKTQLYITFDEILCNNTVDFKRLECCNAIYLELCGGKHKFQLFEPYTMQYVQVTVIEGNAKIANLGMIEYKHPPVLLPNLRGYNENINLIAKAALESYRQNSVDIFTDCPSRERAGWLCDSFFMARTEYILTGESLVEKNFLENYLHEDFYTALPSGMIPMCYPSEQKNGIFIPNWAMWFILQLKDYYKRTNDDIFINRAKNKVYNILNYFKDFENEYGLLEKLEGWKFVEWSKANEFVDDVNYPTNMMYYASLNAVAELYGDTELTNKSEKLKDIIIEKSFNGEFFVDNAVYVDGVLTNTSNTTEVCQYYAFFTKVATPAAFKKLFDVLVWDFGPNRTDKWKNVYGAAPFIGNYLRLDILSENGYSDLVVSNIEDYFLNMAKTTGTLWEHADIRASCNHGFTSCILYWLIKIIKGV